MVRGGSIRLTDTQTHKHANTSEKDVTVSKRMERKRRTEKMRRQEMNDRRDELARVIDMVEIPGQVGVRVCAHARARVCVCFCCTCWRVYTDFFDVPLRRVRHTHAHPHPHPHVVSQAKGELESGADKSKENHRVHLLTRAIACLKSLR